MLTDLEELAKLGSVTIYRLDDGSYECEFYYWDGMDTVEVNRPTLAEAIRVCLVGLQEKHK